MLAETRNKLCGGGEASHPPLEVAPAYDHMEITQLAGAYVALDLVGLVGHTKSGNSQCEAALKMEL